MRGPQALTLEALGGRLPQGEEDVTHDGGAAHPRFGDDAEHAVHELPQVLLQRRRAVPAAPSHPGAAELAAQSPAAPRALRQDFPPWVRTSALWSPDPASN